MCNEPPGNLLKKQILIQSGVCAFLTSSKVNAGPASNDAAKTQHSSQAPNMPAQLGTSSQLSVKWFLECWCISLHFCREGGHDRLWGTWGPTADKAYSYRLGYRALVSLEDQGQERWWWSYFCAYQKGGVSQVWLYTQEAKAEGSFIFLCIFFFLVVMGLKLRASCLLGFAR
jgi:hypothetical protein